MSSDGVLHVYRGINELPSIDFDSLRAMCAVKWSSAPIIINSKGNSFFSRTEIFPYLTIDNNKYVGYKQIEDYLLSEGYNINLHLSRDDDYLSTAYEIYVYNNLHPYFHYILFGEPVNVDKTRSRYASQIRFPFNFVYPSRYFEAAKQIIETFWGFSINDSLENHNTADMIYNAKVCINQLAIKLGEKKYFFGSGSKFDVMVYSYCAILCHLDLPSNPLGPHIKSHSNLLKYINEIGKKYFKDEIQQTEKQPGGQNLQITPSEQMFQATKTKTQILAGLGAVVAMGLYAAFSGLLKISLDDQYDPGFYYEDEVEDEMGSE